MKSLSEYNRTLRPTRHNADPDKPQYREIPKPRRLQERRFLPMVAGGRAEMVWIDDDRHEREHHIHNDDGSVQWSKWHRFEDESGRFWAIRCPSTLEESEKTRARADIPPGVAADILRSYAQESRRPKRATEEWNP